MFKLNKPWTFISRRSLSTGTYINPTKVQLNRPDNEHKSLILLTTPSQLNNCIKEIIDFSESKFIKKSKNDDKMNQILVACVDTISGSRNGYSFMWLVENFNISQYETLDHRNESLKRRKHPLSVDPIKMDKTWKDTKENTKFQMLINDWEINVNTFLANTIFQNSESNTCFYVGHEKYDWQNLSTISISLDDISKEPILKKNTEIKYSNRLTEIPLIEDPKKAKEHYLVTEFEGNMIKTIEDESASSYLTNNSIVMSSKKDLYFKLSVRPESTRITNAEYYKLIVGGLGWGEKQAFIAVDPIVRKIRYRFIKLFYYDHNTPKHVYKSPDNPIINKFIFECSEIEDGYEDYGNTDKETVYLSHVFSLGCEQGFQLNNTWHRANGEVIET
jgi:hypothetical protein